MSTKSKKHVSVILALILLIAIILSGTYFSNISFFEIESHIKVEADGSVLIKLFDQLGDSDLSNYTHSDTKRINLMRMISEMSSEDNYHYYHTIYQPLFVDGQDIFQKGFLYDSEQRNTTSPQDSDNADTWIKSIQLSENAFDFFGLNLLQGNALKSQDFIWSPGKNNMNCLVGYNYSPFLSIGDNLDVVYLNQSIELNIVGVLTQGSAIDHYGESISLDNYIIMPAVDVTYETSDIDNIVFQVALLSQEANGLYRLDGVSYVGSFLEFFRSLENKFTIPHALLNNIENRESAIVVSERLRGILGELGMKSISIVFDAAILFGIYSILKYLEKRLFHAKSSFLKIMFLFSIVAAINILQYFSQIYFLPGLPYSTVGTIFIVIGMVLPILVNHKSKSLNIS